MVTNILISIFVLVGASVTQAAVIYSSCPVQSADGQNQVNRSHEKSWLAGEKSRLRSYSDSVQYGVYALAYLASTGRELIYNPKDYAEQARLSGQWIEDIQLALQLKGDEKDCQAPDAPQTLNLAIFPFVRKPAGPLTAESVRVVYKACEYYVDQKRQIPFEDACRTLGSEDGYTFAALESRLNGFKSGLQKTRNALDAGLYTGSAVAALTVLRGLRALKMGRLTSLTGALVPPVAVGSAIHLGARDDLLRDLVHMESAGEIAVTGDLSTSVKVSRPMQTFIPYFERYLNSIGAPVAKVSQVQTPAPSSGTSDQAPGANP